MKCPKCNTDKDFSQFYIRSDRPGKSHSYCKQCVLNQTVKRQRDFKIKCVEYKGGKCIKCGYSKSVVALDFHHRDPNQKDFSISKHRGLNWEKNKEKVIKELDKCDLLCANCHREEHDK